MPTFSGPSCPSRVTVTLRKGWELSACACALSASSPPLPHPARRSAPTTTAITQIPRITQIIVLFQERAPRRAALAEGEGIALRPRFRLQAQDVVPDARQVDEVVEALRADRHGAAVDVG